MKQIISKVTAISLRIRIIILLIALIITTIGGGLVTIWYADTFNSIFISVVDRDVASFELAEELESALIMQKGLTSYYFQDGDQNWLVQLAHYQKLFEEKLKKAREQARTEESWKILSRIESEYLKNKSSRNQVIHLYQMGQKEAALKLLQETRRQSFIINDLCAQFQDIYRKNIVLARENGQLKTRYITTGALIAIQVAAMMGIFLAYILFKQVLGPIRQLTRETGSLENEENYSNEVRVLSHRVHSLIEDVDQTQNKLARSQEHLLQSEKWAMTGKLAASVAHSIRNPLTSVKIRLFSMGRAAGLSPTQKEDLEVISEEIGHIESIVSSFLQFSRPPKLVMQKISPSEIVDLALRLLQHRLESFGVKVERDREKALPEIWADPDQLKEVLVNLLVNACEMMANGGIIRISEEVKEEGLSKPAIVITITDNGPGIPESIQENIFQPFFSTKEEGTGLGLSIANRIVEKHGGTLSLRSQEGQGATFEIILPQEEKNPWA
jgi:signal transduction histidine kinase